VYARKSTHKYKKDFFDNIFKAWEIPRLQIIANLKIKKAEEWRVSSAFRLEGILVKGY
jgi:hypothetical protein